MRHARAAVIVAAIATLAATPVASGHEGNPDFRSEIDRITPPVAGVTIEVLNFDDSLRIENRSGRDVVIEGYEGEPYARLTAEGTVSLNTRSPAYYLNGDRFAAAQAPASADPDAPPAWERLDGSSSLTWHDHRMHWMSRSVPSQVEDPSQETKVFDYSIPLRVGGRPAAIEGTLTWVGREPGAPLLPFAVLGAVALIAAAGLVAARRRRRSAGREAW
jgi:hypothetical protein